MVKKRSWNIQNATNRQPFATVANTRPMRIRVRKVPPTEFLEGFDVRRYQFRVGEVYEVGPLLGAVLIGWQYAEPEILSGNPDEPAQANAVRPPPMPPNLIREMDGPYLAVTAGTHRRKPRRV